MHCSNSGRSLDSRGARSFCFLSAQRVSGRARAEAEGMYLDEVQHCNRPAVPPEQIVKVKRRRGKVWVDDSYWTEEGDQLTFFSLEGPKRAQRTHIQSVV